MAKDQTENSKRQSTTFKQFARHVVRALRKEYLGISDQRLYRHRNQYLGQSCFVVGNGPSLGNVARETLELMPSFGTNGIFLKFLPTFFVTISSNFYLNHVEAIRTLKGPEKFIASELKSIHTGAADETLLQCNWPRYGMVQGWGFPVPLKFSTRPDRLVYLGGSVLFVCLQMALWFGFKNVILVGVDHKFGFDRKDADYWGKRLLIEGKDDLHFSPDYSKTGYQPHVDMLATERAFRLARRAFDKRGGKIVNATPNTGLDVIEKVSLEQALNLASCSKRQNLLKHA